MTFDAATLLSNVGLYAIGGGQILFPAATSYTGYNYGDTAIEASGAGSWIDLSSLATFYGGGEYSDSHGYGHYYTTYVNALAGGKVDLAGAVSHRNVITVDGAESVLGVAGITKLGGTVLTINTPGTLTFTTATEVTDSNLTAPTDVALAFTGATKLQSVNLTATGGGQILFPVAVSYMRNDYGDTVI